MQISAHTKRRH